jgi:hypothetical protein
MRVGLGGIEKEHHDALPRGNPRDATPAPKSISEPVSGGRLDWLLWFQTLFFKVFLTLLLKELQSWLMFFNRGLVG